MFRRPRLTRACARFTAHKSRRATNCPRLDVLEDRTVPSYTFTTINVPGSIDTQVDGNNDLGDIVGAYRSPNNVVHGFVLSGGVYTTIDPPGSLGTNAAGINNSGDITGIFGPAGTRDYGFLLSGGTYTSINPPGSTENGANKINSAGDIVGGYSTGGFLIDQRGYLLSGGNFTTIEVAGATDTYASGINDSGQIVGAFGDFHSGVRHGYLLSSGTYTSFDGPGANLTDALAINNAGQIVGRYNDGSFHGYMLKGGAFTTIDVPASTYTEADGINNLGVIVGTFEDGSGRSHGFLATPDDNHAPTLDPISGQSVVEGGTVTLTATATDPDAGQTLTYSLDFAPRGAVIDPDTGEFTWTAGDGPASAAVIVRVTDNGSPALSDTQIFHITVDNVAPAAGVAGPTNGVPGQSRLFTLNAVDSSAEDQTAGFKYSIDWGDGTTETATGPSGMHVPHTFTATWTFTVQVTATDKDGGQSDAATQDVAIQSVVLEGNTLAVGGTLDDDDIAFQSANHGNAVKVLIDGVSQGSFTGVANLLAFGQAGNDNTRVGSAIALPVTLVGGDGDDNLVAGAGNAVLLGGNGTDRLQGGPGNDAIDGGAGFLDVLSGGGGNDTITDPDGVSQVAGGTGNDDITISFAPDWNVNGSHSLPGGSIIGGAGDDVIRVTADNAAMRFDVSGNGGDDRIELSGTWDRVRVYGGTGTDTLTNLGVGIVVPSNIEVFE